MDTTLAVLAIVGVMSGSAISSIRGWWNAPDTEKFSIKKLSGSVLLAAIQAPLVIGYATLIGSVDPVLGPLGAFFTSATQGFTIDQLHSGTKN